MLQIGIYPEYITEQECIQAEYIGLFWEYIENPHWDGISTRMGRNEHIYNVVEQIDKFLDDLEWNELIPTRIV